MSKNVDFVRERIENYCDFGFTGNASYIELSECIDIGKCPKHMRHEEDERITHLIMEYDPDADFEYITTCGSVHDGTLLFNIELVNNVVKKLFSGCTYDNRKKRPCDCEVVKYTFGNPVLVTEVNKKFARPDKPWMYEKAVAAIPLKYEVIK